MFVFSYQYDYLVQIFGRIWKSSKSPQLLCSFSSSIQLTHLPDLILIYIILGYTYGLLMVCLWQLPKVYSSPVLGLPHLTVTLKSESYFHS